MARIKLVRKTGIDNSSTQIGGIHQGVAGGVQFGDERRRCTVAEGLIRALECAGSHRKICRLRPPCYVCVSRRVDRYRRRSVAAGHSKHPLVLPGPTKKRRVQKLGAIGVEFGYKSCTAVARRRRFIFRLVSSRSYWKIKRARYANHVGVPCGVYRDAVSLVASIISVVNRSAAA